MNPTKVMVNGIPGNMAVNVAQHILADKRFELVPYSLTGPEIQAAEHKVEAASVRLLKAGERGQVIEEIAQKEGAFLSVDFTHPSAVNANAEFYCNYHLAFVMGTTGGDRNQLEETVRASSISAVIAPNMAKQIVGFQAMMEYGAQNFPDLFKGYALEIKESHQNGKADTSGTAKAMVRYFNQMGLSFNEDQIVKERDPEIQSSQWGIPQEYLAGHGWHTYALISGDKTVRFEFTHNVNGRDVYAKGTLDALVYLSARISEGNKGKVYTMIDVLKGL
ncbi:MAG: dihydrodipicolinate reductase [Desulfobacterales bacterium]|jgi:4-hydroxy-tetrahydrodipicolinate reductase|nr:dihydrodipicolinate reductase [Desulfobacterales bacterium]